MNVPFDLHSHCDLSFDGESSAEEMIVQAINLGMKYYALTDHVDLGDHTDPGFNLEATVNGAREQIPELQRKYAEKTKVIYGVELGQIPHDPETAKKLIDGNGYDFIIASIHNIRGFDDFYFLDYTKTDPEKLLESYFAELRETAENCDFDVMGHITYPLRYIEGEYGIEVDMSRCNGIIDDIFRILIKRDRGIEINTSGLRQKLGRTMPDGRYIRRWHELGGRILTIGSDAHRVDDLGKGISEGIETAKTAGFDKITVFIERKPIFVGI